MNLKPLIIIVISAVPSISITADTITNFKYLMNQTCAVIKTAHNTWREVNQWVPLYHIVFEDSDDKKTKSIKKHGLLTLQEQAARHLIARQPFDPYWPLATTRIFLSPNHNFHEHNEKFKNKLSDQKYTVVATLVNPETTKVYADICMASCNLARYEKTGTLYREWEKNEQKYKQIHKHLDKEYFEIVRNVEKAGEPVLVPKGSSYEYPYKQQYYVEVSLSKSIDPKYLSIFQMRHRLCKTECDQERQDAINTYIALLRLRTWMHKTIETLNTHPLEK